MAEVRSQAEYSAEELGQFPSGTILLSRELKTRVMVDEPAIEYDPNSTFFFTPQTRQCSAQYYQAKFHPSKYSPAKFHAQIVENVSRFGFMSIGTDPEFFLRDSAGKLLPAFKFLGAKDSLTPAEQRHGWPYWDGFQAEFGTAATSCLDDQMLGVSFGVARLQAHARKHDGKISHESVVEIPLDELISAQEQHVQLGCQPSENAYLMSGEKVGDARRLPIRFAGGHLHFGIADRLEASRHRAHEITGAVKTLDALIGVGMVSMAAGFDDSRRRKYYGLAGEYRLPPHGLEYRTLSNFWATHPSFGQFTYDIARTAVRLGIRGMRDVVAATDGEVVAAINGTDVKLARKILERNKPLWTRIFAMLYGETFAHHPDALGKCWETLMNGPGVVGIDPTQLEANWQTHGKSLGGSYRRRWSDQVKGPDYFREAE